MEYCNLKRYDEKGRRVAIFGKTNLDKSKMTIFVETCSKKDQFRKDIPHNLAKYFFLNSEERFKVMFPDYHPKILEIEINPEKPKYSFLKWCKENYFLKKTDEIKLYGRRIEATTPGRIHVSRLYR